MASTSDEARAYRDKLRSLQFAGRGKVTKPRTVIDKTAGTKSTPVPDDDHSRHVGGYQIEHKDGRVDARIHPPTVKVDMKEHI